MLIKSSTALRSDYTSVSNLAHETGDPIYITKNGEGDLVVMSTDAFDKREERLEQRARVLEAEARRLMGEVSFSTDDVREMLKKKYAHAKAGDSCHSVGRHRGNSRTMHEVGGPSGCKGCD